jgi:TonB family protein
MADTNGEIQFSTTIPLGERPVSIGRPHICANDYPKSAIQIHAEGTTTLAFTIKSDGTVKDIKVSASSGNKDLDDAAMSCASKWVYQPAAENGRLVETPWQASVAWKLGEPPAVRRAMQCYKYRKDTNPISPRAGSTNVVFRVLPDGAVKDAKVTLSSGDQSLDEAAILCSEASHFDVSMFTFPPEGIPAHAELDWAHMPPIPPPPIPPTK